MLTVLWWRAMNTELSHSRTHRIGLAATVAAVSALVAIPFAVAAPTAVPPSDGQGYIDSTARCSKPDTAVIFGTTDTSRVAICQTSAGAYQYRGVRVRDGAKLIVAAKKASDGTYTATNDGVTYTVSSTALTVSLGKETLRSESWTDFNGPQAPTTSTPSTSGTVKPSTSSPATPTTSASAPASAGPTTSASAAAPKTSAAPSQSSAALPPPLPAEVGGGS